MRYLTTLKLKLNVQYLIFNLSSNKPTPYRKKKKLAKSNTGKYPFRSLRFVINKSFNNFLKASLYRKWDETNDLKRSHFSMKTCACVLVICFIPFSVNNACVVTSSFSWYGLRVVPEPGFRLRWKTKWYTTDATTDPVIKRPKDISREKVNCHKRIKVSSNVKLVYPLDFQLRVSASILVDVSIPFAFQRQRVLAVSSI